MVSDVDARYMCRVPDCDFFFWIAFTSRYHFSVISRPRHLCLRSTRSPFRTRDVAGALQSIFMCAVAPNKSACDICCCLSRQPTIDLSGEIGTYCRADRVRYRWVGKRVGRISTGRAGRVWFFFLAHSSCYLPSLLVCNALTFLRCGASGIATCRGPSFARQSPHQHRRFPEAKAQCLQILFLLSHISKK